MPHPIRYAILDAATDQPALWHLTYAQHVVIGGDSVEVHPPRTVEEVRPHLADLLREGHIEVFPFRDPESPHLPLDPVGSVRYLL